MKNNILILMIFILFGCGSGVDTVEQQNISNDLETYADSIIQAEIKKSEYNMDEKSKLLADSISNINLKLLQSKKELEQLESELDLMIRDNDDQDIAYEKKAAEIRLLKVKIQAAEIYMQQLRDEMPDSSSAADTIVNNVYHTIEKSNNKLLAVYVILGLFILVVVLSYIKQSNTKKDIE